jgi:hypothetical protein
MVVLTLPGVAGGNAEREGAVALGHAHPDGVAVQRLRQRAVAGGGLAALAVELHAAAAGAVEVHEGRGRTAQAAIEGAAGVVLAVGHGDELLAQAFELLGHVFAFGVGEGGVAGGHQQVAHALDQVARFLQAGLGLLQAGARGFQRAHVGRGASQAVGGGFGQRGGHRVVAGLLHAQAGGHALLLRGQFGLAAGQDGDGVVVAVGGGDSHELSSIFPKLEIEPSAIQGHQGSGSAGPRCRPPSKRRRRAREGGSRAAAQGGVHISSR